MVPAGSTVSAVAEERYQDWLDRFLGTFGLDASDTAVVRHFRAVCPPSRAIAITDTDDRFVATATAIDLDLVLPGERTVSMAGVTGVAVDPPAARQGLLRAMLSHLHRRAVDECRAVAGLSSSQWPIYGRFGYGPATWFDSVTIHTRAAGWHRDAPVPAARPRGVDLATAERLGRLLHPRQATRTPGDAAAPPSYWDRLEAPAGSWSVEAVLGLVPSGTGPRRSVAVDDRALASYGQRPGHTAAGTPAHVLHISDLIALDPEAAATLWRHLLGIDLVATIEVPRLPVDDPLRWWVDDARQLVTRRHDGLWLRPLDVPRLLEHRRWAGSGTVVVSVHDPEGYAEGTFRLDVDTGQASCRRTSAEPDLEMGVSALGAIVLGGTSAAELARSGRIEAPDPATALLWDRLARPERAPYTSWVF